MRLVTYRIIEMIPPALDHRRDNLMPVQGCCLLRDENAAMVDLSLTGQSWTRRTACRDSSPTTDLWCAYEVWVSVTNTVLQLHRVEQVSDPKNL